MVLGLWFWGPEVIAGSSSRVRFLKGLILQAFFGFSSLLFFPLVRSGVGVYPLTSMANHSCTPNAMQAFHGSSLVLRCGHAWLERLGCWRPPSLYVSFNSSPPSEPQVKYLQSWTCRHLLLALGGGESLALPPLVLLGGGQE